MGDHVYLSCQHCGRVQFADLDIGVPICFSCGCKDFKYVMVTQKRIPLIQDCDYQ